MRVIFFGTPEFAVPSVRALLECGEEVVAVVTQPDRLKGRGHKISAPPVKEFALQEGIPVMQPSGIRSDAFFGEISALRPDLIAVVAYGRILPPSILNLPRLGCVNVHGSLLPKYRGAAPIQWAIINGEEKTGVTTMLMDDGLDTGDILLREETVIAPDDDAYTLGRRLSGIGASLLVRTVKGLRDGLIQAAPQQGEPSFARPLRKEDGEVNWAIPAKKIIDLIRGTRPWPGVRCALNGERITIVKALETAREAACEAGRIEKASGDELHVCTGRGILSILEVKPEGKKAMSAADFINGRRLKAGMSFDAV